MNVYRFANFYLLGRNIYPNYVLCSSFYKIDNKNIFPALSTREHYTRKRNTFSEDAKKIENIRRMHLTPKFNDAEVTEQVLSFFKTIRMEDMKEAPHPVFWYSTASLIPILGPPLSFIIFGYSPLLASIQLAFAATLCSFAGGMKWGYALTGTEHQPTWENLGWSVVPQMLGWFSILMPQSLGYLLVIFGVTLSTYIDLSATNYPCWFKSIRLALILPTLFGLILSAIIHIFH